MVDTLKSASITNSDASPVVPNTTGEGGPGYTKNASDYVTPTTGGLGSTSSTYRVLRLPTNAKLKTLKMVIDTALDSGSPSLAWDIGAYYSDGNDGSPAAEAGGSISVNCFAAAKAVYSAGETDVLTSFAVALRNEPLWEAVGLTSDPGGFIDIVAGVHTAANTAASHNFAINASYVE